MNAYVANLVTYPIFFFFCILCNWAKTTNNPVTAITTQRPHPLLHANHRGRAGWSHITMNAGWQDRACVKALPRHVVTGSGPQLYQECDKSSLNPEHPMEGQWETSTPALLLSSEFSQSTAALVGLLWVRLTNYLVSTAVVPANWASLQANNTAFWKQVRGLERNQSPRWEWEEDASDTVVSLQDGWLEIISSD